MISAFDDIAEDYDRDFTLTETGKLARRIVMEYVGKNIIKNGHLRILELNCGTGEDAIQFHSSGNEVVATDISAEMIRIARAKAGTAEGEGLTFMQLSFGELPQAWMTEQFDLVFSDFGGLNCINEHKLSSLFQAVKVILKPGGRFVGVIMPAYCLWEIFYFTLKGQWKTAFRRKVKGPVSVSLGGTKVNTWFYSPGSIKKIAREFEIIAIRPVGLILPPSFLEGFFRRKKKLLKLFNLIDRILGRSRLFAGISDHFLFDLKK
jgi:ubiquinone/menaquinone biosynthesis C-methylase UbiE